MGRKSPIAISNHDHILFLLVIKIIFYNLYSIFNINNIFNVHGISVLSISLMDIVFYLCIFSHLHVHIICWCNHGYLKPRCIQCFYLFFYHCRIHINFSTMVTIIYILLVHCLTGPVTFFLNISIIKYRVVEKHNQISLTIKEIQYVIVSISCFEFQLLCFAKGAFYIIQTICLKKKFTFYIINPKRMGFKCRLQA